MMPDNIERAAVVMAEAIARDNHSQRCPVWTRTKSVTSCDCWVLTTARRDAQSLAEADPPILTPEHDVAQARIVAALEIHARHIGVKGGIRSDCVCVGCEMARTLKGGGDGE
jgi:hypothetical protein